MRNQRTHVTLILLTCLASAGARAGEPGTAGVVEDKPATEAHDDPATEVAEPEGVVENLPGSEQAAPDAAAADDTAGDAAASQPAGDAAQQGDSDADSPGADSDVEPDVEPPSKGCKRCSKKPARTPERGFCNGELCFDPGLRIRLNYEAVEDDASVSYVGRNDGFYLSSARLKIRGSYGDWVRFYLSVEGGFIDSDDANVVAGRTFAALKDAWMDVRPFDFFQARVGQFKTPFDGESLRSTAGLRFADRSVASRGVSPGRGYEVRGLSPAREVGVMVGSESFDLGPVNLLYLASATNGNGINQAYNDNSYPSLQGRLELGFADYARLGVAGIYNPRSEGVLPNLYDETDLGMTADLSLRAMGAFVDLAFYFIDTQHPTTLAPASQAMGASAELGYVLWFGLGAGYRFSWYDPTSTFADDALMEHSLAVRYDLPGVPVAVLMDYTVVLEQPGRELQNNRITGLVQLDF